MAALSDVWHSNYVYHMVYAISLFLVHITNAVVIADVIVYSKFNQTIDEFKSMPAGFGPDIPLQGIKGYAALAEPIHACAEIDPPPSSGNISGIHWFALIRRGGGCKFDEKVKNAENAKFHAAIVYNVGSDDLHEMQSSGLKIHIPSVFVGQTSGDVIIERYLYYTGHYLEITSELPFNINQYLLPFIIIIGICFFIMFVFMIIRFVRDYRRRQRSRLSKANLKKIPIQKFKKGETDYDVCAVCLDDYEDGDKLRVLPCSHAYHAKCIDPWLTKNKRSCPVCKRKVIPGDVTDSDSDTDSDSGGAAGGSERDPLIVSSSGSGTRAVSTPSGVGSGSGSYGAVAGPSGGSYGSYGSTLSSASPPSDQDEVYATPSTSVTSPPAAASTHPQQTQQQASARKRKAGGGKPGKSSSRTPAHPADTSDSDSSSTSSDNSIIATAVIAEQVQPDANMPLDNSVATVHPHPNSRRQGGGRRSGNGGNTSSSSNESDSHNTTTSSSSRHNLIV